MSPMPGASVEEDRIELLDDGRLPANHHAVPTLETPDASARPDVHVVEALRREFLRAPDVVDVVRIATVDQDVARLEQRDQIVDARIDDGCRDHQPDHPRLTELPDKLGERRRALRTCGRKLRDRARIAIVDDAWVLIAQEAAHHVRAHPPKTDHSELHDDLLLEDPRGHDVMPSDHSFLSRRRSRAFYRRRAPPRRNPGRAFP